MSARRVRVRLFAGPSLSAADVQAELGPIDADVVLLPPIQQGDILRLANELPDVIGIVDGLFFHAPAVLHREILLALERGVRVLGASSIGALRAAELDGFGMEGVGEIYRLYRTGAIEADDEVAVLHAPAAAAYRPLTEALVTVRRNLRLARRRRAISAGGASAALRAMRALHFTRRTRAALLAAVPGAERPRFAAFLAREAVDLKRLDALRLVRTIARRVAGAEAWPRRMPVRLNRTSLFYQYQREYVGQRVDGGHVPDALVVGLAALLSPSFGRLCARLRRRSLALEEAGRRKLAPAGTVALVARFRRERGLRDDAALEAWRRRHGLTEEELLCSLRERDLEARVLGVERGPRPARRAGGTPWLIHPGVPCTEMLVRELKLRGRFAPAAAVAHRILRHNTGVFARHPSLAGAPARRGLLVDLAARRWRVATDEVEAAMLARGFGGHEDFAAAARHVLVYERTCAGPYRPERLGDCFHLAHGEGPS